MEEPLFSAPLSKANDQDRVRLFQNELVVLWKGKDYRYPLSQVKSLNYSFNRRLMSLVLGGILAPLSIVAYFKAFVPGREAVLYLVLGMGLLYHGWRGRFMFSIESHEGRKLILTTYEGNQALHGLVQAFYQMPRTRL